VARQGRARPGAAGLGEARQAWRGLARPGMARQGVARPGVAGFGAAGPARLVAARQAHRSTGTDVPAEHEAEPARQGGIEC